MIYNYMCISAAKVRAVLDAPAPEYGFDENIY